MKISELIHTLEKFKTKYGDLKIVICDLEEYNYYSLSDEHIGINRNIYPMDVIGQLDNDEKKIEESKIDIALRIGFDI